jgi:hypothetical protein
LAISGTNSMCQLLTTKIIFFFNPRYYMMSFFFLTIFIYLFIYRGLRSNKKKKVLGDSEAALSSLIAFIFSPLDY